MLFQPAKTRNNLVDLFLLVPGPAHIGPTPKEKYIFSPVYVGRRAGRDAGPFL